MRMPFSSKISDYLQALQTDTEGKTLHIPGSLWRIGLSRTAYKLGPRLYSMFRLGSKDISTWSDYLDDDPLKPLMRTWSSESDREVVTDKILFHRDCIKHDLSTAPICGIFKNPSPDDHGSDLPRIASPGQFQAILDAHPEGLFCKPHDGTHGIGAFAILRHAAGWSYPEGTADTRKLFEYCTKRVARSVLLVQPRLINAAPLRPLMAENGFGTIRAVTYMHDDEPRLLAACLRIIVEGNAADNFSQGTSGNFVAPIEPSSGRLIALRGSRSRSWPVIYDADRHPINSFPVAGFELPHWNECIRLMFRGQKAFGRVPSIGWDIGITDNGPVLVEGNTQYDFDLLQLAFDRGFKPDLQKIIAAHQNRRPRPPEQR
jgi:hypothetical protein